MKRFFSWIFVFSAFVLIVSPAQAGREMRFTRDLELEANNGFSDRYLTTTFYMPADTERSYPCEISKLTKVGEQPTIAAGRTVLVEEGESTESRVSFKIFNWGHVSGELATISCPKRDPLDSMKRVLGLELVNSEIKRVPIRYESMQQEHKAEDAAPQLIPPVIQKEDSAGSIAVEL